MELLEGIRSRNSIRVYKHDPVSREILMELLEIATRAPSGVNSQPWEFFVVKGSALDALKRASLDEYRRGTPPHPEVPVGPIRGVAPVLEGIYRERKIELAKQIFGAMGIKKEDREAREKWNESMVQFYHAPAIIIIVVDKMLQGSWPIMDIGFVSQNIALAAQAFGLGTCVMRAIVDYPERIREVVGIPKSKRIIVGISIGRPEMEHPVNRLLSNREKIEKIVTVVE